MTTKEALALALTLEEGKTRDLYNALRSGDHGVSLESLARALYFLQHAHFTLFDVKDAFHSSTGANDRFLGYREFQIALGKIARVKYQGNRNVALAERLGTAETPVSSPQQRRRMSEVEMVFSLVNDLVGEHHRPPLDVLRSQLARPATLDTLERHLPRLAQSFQLYGTQNRLAKGGVDSAGMTLDGFVDFLNAYFEYEEFFSFDDLTQMATEVLAAFSGDVSKAEAKEKSSDRPPAQDELFFAQFLELFCRVAAAFHHQLLVREGAQLRRAVQVCRLEFSLEVLLEHMRITLIRDDGSLSDVPAQSPSHEAEVNVSSSLREHETATLTVLVQDIRELVQQDVDEQNALKRAAVTAKNRLRRDGSMLALKQSAKKPGGAPAAPPGAPSAYSTTSHRLPPPQRPSVKKPPPQVAMIREVAMPPPLPSSVLQLLESAIKFQNMAQFHMALGALDSCQMRLEDLRPPPSDDSILAGDDGDGGDPNSPQTEVQLFFVLQTASVYDSARRDAQALAKYREALTLARLLPTSHPGRVLAMSCLGVTLFYVGELTLARQCLQLVLEKRKAADSTAEQTGKHAGTKADGGPSRVRLGLINMATAMNNLACCLAHEPVESPTSTTSSGVTTLEEAYLLFKHARQIYADAFGPAHPRVEVLTRNLERVRVRQRVVVSDAAGALARGEYAHVIPGSTFQICALESVARPTSGAKKSSRAGAKKKKGAK